MLSLLGRYFYNIKDTNIFHVYIILDFSLTYRNASVHCQSKCACLHTTVNIVVYFVLLLLVRLHDQSSSSDEVSGLLQVLQSSNVFFVKSHENTYPKGRALMQMYRVVPITKRGHSARIQPTATSLYNLQIQINTVLYFIDQYLSP